MWNCQQNVAPNAKEEFSLAKMYRIHTRNFNFQGKVKTSPSNKQTKLWGFLVIFKDLQIENIKVPELFSVGSPGKKM